MVGGWSLGLVHVCSEIVVVIGVWEMVFPFVFLGFFGGFCVGIGGEGLWV